MLYALFTDVCFQGRERASSYYFPSKCDPNHIPFLTCKPISWGGRLMHGVQSHCQINSNKKKSPQFISALSGPNSNSSSTSGGNHLSCHHSTSSPRMCIALIYYSPLCGWPVAFYSTSIIPTARRRWRPCTGHDMRGAQQLLSTPLQWQFQLTPRRWGHVGCQNTSQRGDAASCVQREFQGRDWGKWISPWGRSIRGVRKFQPGIHFALWTWFECCCFRSCTALLHPSVWWTFLFSCSLILQHMSSLLRTVLHWENGIGPTSH